MVMNNPIERFNNPSELAQAATTTVLSIAEQAIAKNGVFKIVLAGGNTPNLIYQQLSQLSAQWDKWWVFWGDERCLPADDKERNSLMAMQVWLTKVAIPHAQIFPIAAEHGAQQAARAYERQIESYLPFDLVLLGMGEDGHTASLFPCHPHNADEWVHAVSSAPKLPANRVSLSAKALSNSDEVLFLITGASKAKAFKLWQKGVNLPVAQIKARKNTLIYADAAALG